MAGMKVAMRYGPGVQAVNGFSAGAHAPARAALAPAAVCDNVAKMSKASPSVRLVLLASVMALAACCKKTPPPASPATATLEAPPASASPKPQPKAAERPQTKEACDACRGEWKRHGLAEVEVCRCRTKDGGKVCRDGKDCEGQCIAGDDDFIVADKGPPPRGHYQGKCSEFDTTFGCLRLVPEGASKRGPLPADDAADNICID
jgi:hypothetical protein